MSRKICEALQDLLAQGRNRIGEILIEAAADGYSLRNYADAGAADLEKHWAPESAVVLARFDGAGEYRPLKTAPNLRRGWELSVRTIEDLRLALDSFYPAALGLWLALREGRLRPTPLRETSNRQSGMYTVVKKMSNEAGDRLSGEFCSSRGHCLRTILWRLDDARPLAVLPPSKFDLAVDQTRPDAGGGRGFIPLPCVEACNLFIAAARSVVKGDVEVSL